MKPGHLDTESAKKPVTIKLDELLSGPATYAKKSSTTVDRVLYIIAFIGMCETLFNL
jgi:hypothetical protein